MDFKIGQMKKVFAFLVLLVFPVFLLEGFASCVVNEDWEGAPCLDGISNGRFDQRDINKWSDYYQYKETQWMEQKRSEMNQAINENTLKDWVNQSIQNHNVYSYYYFSGRAPDIGEYYGEFEEFMINESSTIHDPYTDDERYQLAERKVPLGGSGIEPEFDWTVIVAVIVGVSLPIGLMFFWRRK